MNDQKKIDVVFKDGTKARITVRELEITELYDFLKFVGVDDSPSLVALCCGHKREWVNTLKLASYKILVAECVNRNFENAMEIVAADPIAQVKNAPFLAAARNAELILASPLPTISPTSRESGETISAPSTSPSTALAPSASSPDAAPASSDSLPPA